MSHVLDVSAQNLGFDPELFSMIFFKYAKSRFDPFITINSIG